MADFTTDFTPAQHAGANTIAPVQVNPVPNIDYSSVIDKGINIFARLGENAAKKEAEARNNATLQEYMLKAGNIAQAHASGNVSSSTASTLQQSLYREYLTANPGLAKDLAFSRNELFGGTEVGNATDEVKLQKEKEKIADAAATEAGFDMSEPMSPELRKARHEAAYASKRAEKALQRLTAEQAYRNAGKAEERETYKFNQAINDRRMADEAEQSLKGIASSEYDAFSLMVGELMGSAQTPEQIAAAQVRINKELFRIKSAAAQAAGAQGRELLGTYVGAFDDLAAFAVKEMKPGAALETLKQQFETKKVMAQLLFMQDPKTAAAVAANSLVPNSPIALTAASNSVTANLTAVSGALASTPLYQLPQVIGGGQGEKAVLDATKEAIDNLNNGKASGDLPKLTKEITQAIDVYARQADQIVKTEGYDPRHLDKLMGFYSDPEVGKAIASGKISPTQRKAMANALGSYSEHVVKSVTATLAGVTRDTGQHESRTVADFVSDFKFEGGKLTIKPVQGWESEGGSVAAQEALRKSEAALTRIVRVGAHNDGTTDYGAWWEKNRHIVMPSVYADPERFPVGFVNPKTGYRFKGGMWTNTNNWEAVPSGSK